MDFAELGKELGELDDKMAEIKARFGELERRATPKVGAVNAHGSRKGKVNITGYYEPSVKAALRWIQAKHPERTIQDMLEEAFDDLFAKYGVPESARLAKKG